MGGMIVSQVASLLGNDIIHSLVLLAPGGVAKDNILMGNLYGQKIDPWNLPDYIENKRGMKVGKAYLESMRDQPIYENIQKYFGNTIVFNGSKDTVVIPPHGKRYADMMPNAEFELVEGDNHNFTVTTDATAQRVAQWLKSHQL